MLSTAHFLAFIKVQLDFFLNQDALINLPFVDWYVQGVFVSKIGTSYMICYNIISISDSVL